MPGVVAALAARVSSDLVITEDLRLEPSIVEHVVRGAAANQARFVLRNDGEFTQQLRSALFPPPSLATLMSGKIEHKLQLAKVAELWFVD
jgi:hypothetical protein